MCACMFVQRNSLPDDAALFIVWLEPYVGTADVSPDWFNSKFT